MKLVLFFFIFLNSCNDNNVVSQFVLQNQEYVKVSIEGHVNKPGLYLVPKNSDVSVLISKAQGYKANAQVINNKVISANESFFVNSNRIKDKINLNEASKEDLISIKGIGPSLATKIIDYRLKINLFTNLSELKNIKGIKDKLFDKIYEYLTT